MGARRILGGLTAVLLCASATAQERAGSHAGAWPPPPPPFVTGEEVPVFAPPADETSLVPWLLGYSRVAPPPFAAQGDNPFAALAAAAREETAPVPASATVAVPAGPAQIDISQVDIPQADIAAELRLIAASGGADRRRDAAQVAAFYAERDFAPLWQDAAGWTPAARPVLEKLKTAADDGLDLRAYPLPMLDRADAAERARADFALSLAAAAYARQATGARVEPARISRLITARPEVVSVEAALSAVSGAGADAGARLAAFNPQDAGYVALRAKLAELRRSTPIARDRIPQGPLLKVGMSDPRVPLIRQRFGLSPDMDAGANPIVYDTKLASLVADFQRENGLKPSGALTPRTVAALSGDEPGRLEATILANMEIHRWLPRALGPDRIEVNVPAYALTLYRDGEVAHRARVIVGKPDSQTPIFSDRMRFLIVNPYWNVPESIISNEMLPKLAADPTYLQRQGYEVSERRGKLIVRQPPGERNALGRIKFMFPNDHAVYLHDTPARGKFSAARRAFSHGCVRVDQPFKLAEMVLGPQNGWSEARVRKMIGGKERTVDLPAPLPIHLQYFTAVVDEKGELKLYDDIYGHAHRVKQALGL